ncbi:MAG: outer membrane lipoprotein carrier protein LolA [Treponema sp.]|nr:outer membrane lipoprotein carrier protein LolA [Treponema sp.]
MKKAFTMLAVLAAFVSASFSQSILTASEFFKSVSDFYGTIQDYEADTDILVGSGGAMRGKVSFKRPEMLRIDFSQPDGQTILFNGETLVIYLPGSSAILQQTVSGSGAAAATPEGLSLMRRYYTVAYESGQTPVPLDEDSAEMVVNLILRRRSASEAFSRMLVSVDPATLLIRRIVATTPADLDYVFYFSNYSLNTGISEQRFIYDPPSSANNYNNFLFSE